MASSSKRKPSSPPSRSPSPSRVLTSSDVQQGNILWLAPHQETIHSLRKRSQHAEEPVHNLTPPGGIPDEGFFNHPILVVSRPAVMPNTIHFLHLTSFNGQKLEKRFRKGPSLANRRNYLTMAPGSNHPLLEAGDPMYQTLTLENNESMERRGYVKISEVYSMDWRDAQPFWRGDPSLRQKTRLSAASLRLLLFATKQVGGYSSGEQYANGVIGLGISGGNGGSSSKSPLLSTDQAAAKPSTQRAQAQSRRPLSLPERTPTPSFVTISAVGRRVSQPGRLTVGLPSAPWTPPAAKTTTTAQSLPARKRSPISSLLTERAGSLPGERARAWDEERQPLLTAGRNGGSGNGGVALENGRQQDSVGFFSGLLDMLKSAVFGTFKFLWFLVKFVARICFR